MTQHTDSPGGHPGSDAMAARAIERAVAGKSLYVAEPPTFVGWWETRWMVDPLGYMTPQIAWVTGLGASR